MSEFHKGREKERTSLCDPLKHRRLEQKKQPRLGDPLIARRARTHQKSEPRLRRRRESLPKDLVDDGLQEDGEHLDLKTAYLGVLKSVGRFGLGRRVSVEPSIG